MKVIATFAIELDTGNTELIEAMKAHSVLVLELRRKYILAGKNAPDEEKRRYRQSTVKVGALIAPGFGTMIDLRWDTADFLTKEEEAIITAPEG